MHHIDFPIKGLRQEALASINGFDIGWYGMDNDGCNYIDGRCNNNYYNKELAFSYPMNILPSYPPVCTTFCIKICITPMKKYAVNIYIYIIFYCVLQSIFWVMFQGLYPVKYHFRAEDPKDADKTIEIGCVLTTLRICSEFGC